jgi:hypothetical protein
VVNAEPNPPDFPRVLNFWDDREEIWDASCASYAAELPMRCTSADGAPRHGEDFSQSLGFRHG